MRPPRRVPTKAVPQFVAPRYGDTAEEDLAFRRGQLLEALTDALVRLLMKQRLANVASASEEHVDERHPRGAGRPEG
jgi:hypothetical protein